MFSLPNFFPQAAGSLFSIMTTATEISRHFQIPPGVGGCHPDLSLGGWYPGGQVLVASAVLAEDGGW